MKEPWKSRPCEAGFTLIELVVAMGLLAVALTAVYQLQGRNLDLHDEARFVTRATQLARARLADVAARSSLTEGEESGSFEEDDGVPSAFGWEEAIEEVMDRPDLYRVRVRVFREKAAGTASRDLAVETLLYRPGDES